MKQMNILIAPNSMKGSLDAFAFADVVEQAFKKSSEAFKTRKLPVADGGDFTGVVLARHLNAQEKQLMVRGPLGEEVSAKYAVADNTAVIEMADASGMKRVERSKLNPMIAGSYGTGEMIGDALKNGYKEIFLAIGGSATVDGGMGMMEALGFRFYDATGNTLNGSGENLAKIDTIKSCELPGDAKIRIICDVDNPLLGENGAAEVFGPQKGATDEMIPVLEKGLANWAGLLEKHCGRELKNLEGAGAAGGIALPLITFMKAEIVPGADFVLQQLGFDEQLAWADLVITGEGKIDSQTLNNKAPFVVAKAARKQNIPVIALAGKVEQEATHVFDGVYSIVNGPMQLEEAMRRPAELLFNTASQLAATLKALLIPDPE